MNLLTVRVAQQKKRIKKQVILLSIGLLLNGCATPINKDFVTNTKMSDTIFLTPVRPALKTVFVDIKNTSGVEKLDCNQDIRQALVSKGYAILNDPDQAHFILQANVLSLEKNQGGVYSKVDGTGALVGGALGAGMGAAIGSGTSSQHAMGGAAIGGLFGLVVGTIIEQAEKERAMSQGLFKFNVNIMVSEKSKNVRETSDPYNGIKYKQGKGGSVVVNFNEQTDKKRYQTDLAVNTNVEMSFDEALILLKGDMIKAIAGIF